MTFHACLWRRLDLPGHDACRFLHDGLGWVTEGCAVFTTRGRVATLSYRLRCDDDWISRSASVQGWIDAEPIAIEIARTARNGWSVNGVEAKDLSGLSDIDLGFTPATNTNAIRRLDLAMGQTGETVAVWLDEEDWTVKPLPQTYTHVDARGYDYYSPSYDFQTHLRTDDFGAVMDYPQLWTHENAGVTALTA